MRVVALVALAGLVALVVALLTDSTFVAVVVIALAAAGILLLARDWRTERRQPALADDESPGGVHDASADAVAAPMTPDMFAPDISADAHGGPSSDARAD